MNADPDAGPNTPRRTSLTPLPDGYGETVTRHKRRSAPGDNLEDDRPARKAKRARHATPPDVFYLRSFINCYCHFSSMEHLC